MDVINYVHIPPQIVFEPSSGPPWFRSDIRTLAHKVRLDHGRGDEVPKRFVNRLRGDVFLDAGLSCPRGPLKGSLDGIVTGGSGRA